MKPMLRPINIQILAVLLIISLAKSIENESESCDVGVQSPWTRPVYIPHGSTTQINCTVPSNDQTPVWTILLSGTQTPSQFSFPQSINLLNHRGFYKLPTVETETSKTIRLLINVTDENNGTNILCEDINSLGRLVDNTTLFIYDPVPVTVMSNIVDLQTFNISWSPLSSENRNQTYMYTLTVTTSNSTSQTFQTDGQIYVFKVPDNAPPCEVYNFSVTATYDGATYTGAGCSEPSPVLSRMLPSPPNVTPLESSLTATLAKQQSGIDLEVSFSPADYCQMYPVVNYTLRIKRSNSFDVQTITSTGTQISVSNLLENVIYSFTIIAENSIGFVESQETEIYTTDVQGIQVVELSTSDNAFRVHCHFIIGSDAQGCVVMLIGEMANHTMELTKSANQSTQSDVLRVEHLPSCYHTVVAFDIESDGTTGNLPIPGHLQRNTDIPCTTTEPVNTSLGSKVQPAWKNVFQYMLFSAWITYNMLSCL